MENNFITITGVNHYFGFKPFKVDGIVKLVKEPENSFDHEAIRVMLPFIDTIGYVANSTNTVFAGTVSAGRLYDKVGEEAFAQVLFITHSSVIAVVIPPEEMEKQEAPVPAPEAVSRPAAEYLRPKAKIGF